jgi:hypothetical protein
MLVLANSMQAYFREALDAAMRLSRIRVTESAQVYVVHLLNEFSRSEKAFAGTDYGEKISITQLLERAFGAEEREALRIYRHLGDTSLYLLGFFEGSGIQYTFYKDMGITAYAHASGLSRAYAINSALIFQELSEKFGDFVTVFQRIANYKDHRDEN